jgi:hypothetical protein
MARQSLLPPLRHFLKSLIMPRQNPSSTAIAGDERYRNRRLAKTRSRQAPLSHPDWKSAYDDALRETDTSKLFELVQIAEPAILMRLDALACGPNHPIERQALGDALHRLRLLKAGRLKFDGV